MARRFKVNFPWTTAGWFWLGIAILYTLYEIVKELGGNTVLVAWMAVFFVVWNAVSWITQDDAGAGVIHA